MTAMQSGRDPGMTGFIARFEWLGILGAGKFFLRC
jgi:hypothetical protein